MFLLLTLNKQMLAGYIELLDFYVLIICTMTSNLWPASSYIVKLQLTPAFWVLIFIAFSMFIKKFQKYYTI